MNQEQLERINKIIDEVHKSGNDVEIRTCKDGIKVVEVHRSVIAII